MHIWDYKITNKKKIPVVWKLERLINHGLGGDKIAPQELRENWDKLKIDPKTREFLRLLLWPKKS